MPAQVFILRHWKKQLRVFLGSLEELKGAGQHKTVHDLRVAVKKLRAYLRLLAVLYPSNDHRLEFESTEQLFSILGKHRDITVGILLLGEFEKEKQETYAALGDHLKKAMEQSAEWMKAAIINYKVEEIKELTTQLTQDLKGITRQELLDKIKRNVEKEYRKASRHASHLSRDTHQVRKLYKDIFYQAEICPPGVLPAVIPLKKIKKVLDQLGSWQDHEMLYRKVRHFRKDFVPASREEYSLLKELEKSIMDKKKSLLDKAEKVL